MVRRNEPAMTERLMDYAREAQRFKELAERGCDTPYEAVEACRMAAAVFEERAHFVQRQKAGIGAGDRNFIAQLDRIIAAGQGEQARAEEPTDSGPSVASASAAPSPPC